MVELHFSLSWFKAGGLIFELSIKRDIGHLCHDEQRPKVQDKPLEAAAAPAPSYPPGILFYTLILLLIIEYRVTVYQAPTPQPTSSWPTNMSIPPFLYQSDMFGNEFSILTYVLRISFVHVLFLKVLPGLVVTSWKPLMMAHSLALRRQSAPPLFLLPLLRIAWPRQRLLP